MTTIDLKVLDARIAEHLPAYATAGSAGLGLTWPSPCRLPETACAARAGFAPMALPGRMP